MREWFMTAQAARAGLLLTLICAGLCVPDLAAAFAPRCSKWARVVVVPRIVGTYKPVAGCLAVAQ